MVGRGPPLSIVLTPGNVNDATVFGQVLDGIHIPRGTQAALAPRRIECWATRHTQAGRSAGCCGAEVSPSLSPNAAIRKPTADAAGALAVGHPPSKSRSTVIATWSSDASPASSSSAPPVRSTRGALLVFPPVGFPEPPPEPGVPVSRKTSARSSACGAGSASPLDRPPAPAPGRPRCARRRAAHSPGQGHVRRWRVRPARPAPPPTALLGTLVWIMPGPCPGARAAAAASGRRFNPPGFRCGLRCVGAVRCRQGAGGRLPGRPRWRSGAGRPPRSRGRRRVRRRPPGRPFVS